MSQLQQARRGDALFLFDASRAGYALVLSRGTPARTEPCELVFDYARGVIASDLPQLFDPEELGPLMLGEACYDWLDRQERFPEPFQSQLATLLTRGGAAATGEVVAAELLCTLQPSFGASAITKLNQMSVLRPFAVERRCRHAGEATRVLAAARSSGDVGAALLSDGLVREPGAARVKEWVLPLLRTRSRLRRYGAPLLHAAQLHRAAGEAGLRQLLCVEEPTPGMPCQELSPSTKEDFRSRDHYRALTKLAIVTGVVGGLGTLAYVGRNDDLGRGIATGTGVVAGAAAGFLITVSARPGGDTAGLGALLLAFPVSILTGVAGGVIASKTSKEPGSARFATAAVPLAITELATVVVTIDGW